METYEDLTFGIMKELGNHYWSLIQERISENPELLKSITGFIVVPEKIIFYLGRTHFGLEYIGSEKINELPESKPIVEIILYDYSSSKKNIIENIIGFDIAPNGGEWPISVLNESLVFSTRAGIQKLLELKWQFFAQKQDLRVGYKPIIKNNSFARIINSMFFDAGSKGLITRHIKWLDLVPIEYLETPNKKFSARFNFNYFKEFVKFDCEYIYPLPNEFNRKRLVQANRFIELIGYKQTIELDITNFLSREENKFILKMGFRASDIYYQLICKWQSEEKDDIQPDFFVVRSDGYADIVEFKLPNAKNKIVVGQSNRETFSAELSSYISQTRTYRYYFEDPENRKWFETKYHFKVYKPRRILIFGSRWDFKCDEWKEIISDYRDIDILTYEDLVDGVVAQLYN